MLLTVASLAPTVSAASDREGLARNVAQLQVAIRAHRREYPGPAVIVLPLGCLSGLECVADTGPLLECLEPLEALATELDTLIAGADRFDGHVAGFLLAPGRGTVIEQFQLGEPQAGDTVAVFDCGTARLAVLVGDDALQPEYARMATFAGAEILLNPCAGHRDERRAWHRQSRGSRAWENHAVLVASGLAGVQGTDGQPAGFVGAGVAEIWEFTGRPLVVAEDGATATIDVEALRRRRADTWINFPTQLRTALYAPLYAAAARSTAPPPPPALESYDVVLMQAHQVFVSDAAGRDAVIEENLQRALLQAEHFCMRDSVKLVVFPEFFLQGADPAAMAIHWEKVGIRVPGPETARLADFARRCGVYLCGAVLETDPDWPRRYFNTSIIISPAGEIVLRYRKIQCADLNGLLNVTTPGNVHSRYVERYGVEALVPVVDTPIGRLGTMICYDSQWPELWRMLSCKGAEVICHPTSEIHMDIRGSWDRAKRAHAAEHMVYLASANAGSEQFRQGGWTTGMNHGGSVLLDFNGAEVAKVEGGGAAALLARIELGTLRRSRERRRARGETGPALARIASAYAAQPGFPLDCFLDEPMLSPTEGPEIVRRLIERFQREDRYVKPRSAG